MMNKNGIRRCKFCGKEVAVITYGIYRKAVVDVEPVNVYADPGGDEYIRFDGISGSKVKAHEAGIDCVFPTEPAYRMHRLSCGG